MTKTKASSTALTLPGFEAHVDAYREACVALEALKARVEEKKQVFRQKAAEILESQPADSTCNKVAFVGGNGEMLTVLKPDYSAESARLNVKAGQLADAITSGLGWVEGCVEVSQEYKLTGAWATWFASYLEDSKAKGMSLDLTGVTHKVTKRLSFEGLQKLKAICANGATQTVKDVAKALLDSSTKAMTVRS